MQRVLALAVLMVVAIIVAPTTAQIFDNDGGGNWTEYMSFPITASNHTSGVYILNINKENWSLYNMDGGLESYGYDLSFWANVQPDGKDIRVFDQEKQLYFEILDWNYTAHFAKIAILVDSNSSVLNIAYGNPLAGKSIYQNGHKVFEFYTNFDDPETELGWSYPAGQFSCAGTPSILLDGDRIIVVWHYNPNDLSSSASEDIAMNIFDLKNETFQGLTWAVVSPDDEEGASIYKFGSKYVLFYTCSPVTNTPPYTLYYVNSTDLTTWSGRLPIKTSNQSRCNAYATQINDTTYLIVYPTRDNYTSYLWGRFYNVITETFSNEFLILSQPAPNDVTIHVPRPLHDPDTGRTFIYFVNMEEYSLYVIYSDDLKTWSSPIKIVDFDSYTAICPTALKVNGYYYLIIHDGDYSDYNLVLYVSKDGISFKKACYIHAHDVYMYAYPYAVLDEKNNTIYVVYSWRDTAVGISTNTIYLEKLGNWVVNYANADVVNSTVEIQSSSEWHGLTSLRILNDTENLVLVAKGKSSLADVGRTLRIGIGHAGGCQVSFGSDYIDAYDPITGTSVGQVSTWDLQPNMYYLYKAYYQGTKLTKIEIESLDGSKRTSSTVNIDLSDYAWNIHLQAYSSTATFDWVFVAKTDDPANFDTPTVHCFGEPYIYITGIKLNKTWVGATKMYVGLVYSNQYNKSNITIKVDINNDGIWDKVVSGLNEIQLYFDRPAKYTVKIRAEADNSSVEYTQKIQIISFRPIVNATNIINVSGIVLWADKGGSLAHVELKPIQISKDTFCVIVNSENISANRTGDVILNVSIYGLAGGDKIWLNETILNAKYVDILHNSEPLYIHLPVTNKSVNLTLTAYSTYVIIVNNTELSTSIPKITPEVNMVIMIILSVIIIMTCIIVLKTHLRRQKHKIRDILDFRFSKRLK